MKLPETVNATQPELDKLLAKAKPTLTPEEYLLLERVFGTFVYVMQALQDAKTSLNRFRKMLFGARTESKANVLGDLCADGHVVVRDVADASGSAANATAVTDAISTQAAADGQPPKAKPGHGRNGAEAYSGAAVVEVALSEPAAGQLCPKCEIGRVYAWPPRTIVKVTGQPPIVGTVYKLQQRRCRACDALFTAPMPEGVTVGQKYDERCVCMLILLRYGYGMPSLTFRCPIPRSGISWKLPGPGQRPCTKN